jgi:hypothetical protein
MSTPNNFPNFPLYLSLAKGVSDINLSDAEKDEIIEKIKLLKDENDNEIIYALTKAFFINNGNISEELPHYCKIIKAGLKIDLDQCPTKLQRILLNFVRIPRDV